MAGLAYDTSSISSLSLEQQERPPGRRSTDIPADIPEFITVTCRNLSKLVKTPFEEDWCYFRERTHKKFPTIGEDFRFGRRDENGKPLELESTEELLYSLRTWGDSFEILEGPELEKKDEVELEQNELLKMMDDFITFLIKLVQDTKDLTKAVYRDKSRRPQIGVAQEGNSSIAPPPEERSETVAGGNQYQKSELNTSTTVKKSGILQKARRRVSTILGLSSTMSASVGPVADKPTKGA